MVGTGASWRPPFEISKRSWYSSAEIRAVALAARSHDDHCITYSSTSCLCWFPLLLRGGLNGILLPKAFLVDESWFRVLVRRAREQELPWAAMETLQPVLVDRSPAEFAVV